MVNNIEIDNNSSAGPRSNGEENVRVLDDTSDHGEQADKANDSDTEFTTMQ